MTTSAAVDSQARVAASTGPVAPTSRPRRQLLAIDDDVAIVDVVRDTLAFEGFGVETEQSGRRAMERLGTQRFDIVLCDLRLGAVDGMEILRHVRRDDPRTAFVLFSGVRDQQIAVHAMKHGADDFIAKPFKIADLRERLLTAVARRGAFSKLLDDEQRLTSKLKSIHQDLHEATLQSIRSLVFSLEAKDVYTKDHSIKVATLGFRIAKRLGLPVDVQQRVRLAGLLHDVGKIGIREDVLRKPGPLTIAEAAHAQQHPLIGERILAPLARRLPDVVAAVKHEHERFDGKGYPSGLRGAEIPLAARIIAVADTFDAITSDRPYRRAQSKEHAAAEIAKGAGTQFDPDVCAAFLNLVPEL